MLAPDALWALADAMPERYRASVVVSFLSGPRAGELFALQREHLDLGAGTFGVEQLLARSGPTAPGRSLRPSPELTSGRSPSQQWPSKLSKSTWRSSRRSAPRH